jgi:hypothetical protein
MDTDTANKKYRRNPKTSRPLKKLLASPLLSLSAKYSVHHYRHLFIQGLSEQNTHPPFKGDLWSGAYLHLLLLTKKIAPDMYQAALTYVYFNRKNLFAAPVLSQRPLEENLLTFERGLVA